MFTVLCALDGIFPECTRSRSHICSRVYLEPPHPTKLRRVSQHWRPVFRCLFTCHRIITWLIVFAETGVQACKECAHLKQERAAQQAVVHNEITRPEVLKPFLVLGRLVRVRVGSTDWGWAVVLQHSYKPPNDAEVRV